MLGSRLKKIGIVSSLVVAGLFATTSTNTFAISDSAPEDVYVMGKKVAEIDARIWVEGGGTFDATSSSWVFDNTVYIGKHKNQMVLDAGSIGVSLSPANAGGASLSYDDTAEKATYTTGSVSGWNATYRGINTYNNVVTGFGWWVNCYSKQSLELDTQPFGNQSHVWKGY